MKTASAAIHIGDQTEAATTISLNNQVNSQPSPPKKSKHQGEHLAFTQAAGQTWYIQIQKERQAGRELNVNRKLGRQS